MPFNTTQAFPPDDPGPDVQIFLHGLLMLSPNADSTVCEVGVHRLSIQHRLSVEVRVKGTVPPDPPLLRLAGTLDSAGLVIGVTTGDVVGDASHGVSKFVTSEGELDRDDPNNDPLDFRWSLDLQKLDPAQPPMMLMKSGISPSVKIMDGLFFTARRTNPADVEVKLTNVGNPDTPLTSVARIIGANIYLQAGENLVLTWFGDGDTKTLVIPKKKAVDRPALIYIDNSPSLMPSQPDHSEFAEYFKVITNATAATRKFDVDFQLIGNGGIPHGTDRAPCMPAVVGG
ncbi:MAG: hypothetical protein QOH42_530 [Blastocatellia bacterium]|jgi:hypothetical protein|nr:hypothetical protein [Blastocatellia bacterium]